MFSSKKKRSWYLLAMWALVFAGFVFSVSRFFMYAVDKSNRAKKGKNGSDPVLDEMFV
jgi:hypothetical protein